MARPHSKHPEVRRIPGIRLGSLFGVEIALDWSLIIIFVLILVNLGIGVLPAWHPEWSAALVWGVAFAAAVLFFVSILAHELSHALVANRNDIPVGRITLFLFGGMAHMEREPPSARAEFKMAIIGPITSIVIGVLATLAGALLTGDVAVRYADDPGQLARSIGPVATLLLWLGPVNVILGVFNLVPGFPLDGGRVLRSAIWAVTGNLRKATRWASTAGRLVAWLIIGLGVLQLFGGNLAGLWLVLIGWFLNNAARASYTQLLVREAFEEIPVRQVMRAHPATVPAEVSVESLVGDYIMSTDQRAFPVLDGGRLAGLVTLDDVRKVPRDQWTQTPVTRVMTPVEKLWTLDPDDDAFDAFHELSTRGVSQIPVVRGGQLEGLVRREDVMKWLSIHGPGVQP